MHKDVTILQAAVLPEGSDRELNETFNVIQLPKDHHEAVKLLRERGGEMRGIAVRHAHFNADELALMPNLEIISSYSAGLDGIDIEFVRSRGVKIHNASKILAEDVADLAIALALATTRGTTRGHDFVRSGAWETGTCPLGRSLRALKIGIVGLGHIGSGVAKRLDVMGAEVAYYGPRKKPADFAFFDEVERLAAWADMLIVTCPATPETERLINQRVLDALGYNGYLVNIARGTIVDEAALIATLARDKIAGAALDVFEFEPKVPEALRNDPRVVLSPHMGSGTRETRQHMGDGLVQALREHFARN